MLNTRQCVKYAPHIKGQTYNGVKVEYIGPSLLPVLRKKWPTKAGMLLNVYAYAIDPKYLDFDYEARSETTGMQGVRVTIPEYYCRGDAVICFVETEYGYTDPVYYGAYGDEVKALARGIYDCVNRMANYEYMRKHLIESALRLVH
ncbi:MAG: hypothetical protein FWD33_00360 [Alphaproteobacteria bacterium]|nr:hypothetical protein [Alphaproteobacteria bacterium]